MKRNVQTIRYILRSVHILFSLILVSCGTGVIGPSVNVGQFDQYRRAFKNYAQQYSADIEGYDTIPIEFGIPHSDTAIAECDVYYLEGRKIIVLESYWNTVDDNSRESILFHEFGHCVLNRVHRTDTVTDETQQEAYSIPPLETPVSLMNPYYINGSVYMAYQQFYLTELFANSNH